MVDGLLNVILLYNIGTYECFFVFWNRYTNASSSYNSRVSDIIMSWSDDRAMDAVHWKILKNHLKPNVWPASREMLKYKQELDSTRWVHEKYLPWFSKTSTKYEYYEEYLTNLPFGASILSWKYKNYHASIHRITAFQHFKVHKKIIENIMNKT